MCWVRSLTAPLPAGRWLIIVASIVSPRYCATPSDRTVVRGLVQVIDQLMLAPSRCEPSSLHCGPNSTGTAFSGVMQPMRVVFGPPPPDDGVRGDASVGAPGGAPGAAGITS